MKNAKLIFLACLLTGSASASSGLYVPVSMGTGHASATGDNMWYQETHLHAFNLRANTWSAGLGYAAPQVSIELNYRHLGKYSVGALWEPDATYYKPSANHAVTDWGITDATIRGVSIDVLHAFRVGAVNLYLGAGLLKYQTHQLTEFYEINTDKVNHVYADANGVTPLWRGGVFYGKVFIEYVYYPKLYTENCVVKSLVQMNLGYRW